MKEQVTINSLEFAQGSHQIHGTISPRELGRLGEVLFSPDGMLDYVLAGSVKAGRPEISLQLKGELTLTCQRCMGPIRHAVDTVTRFVVVPDPGMLPAPEDDQDDVDYLVADPRFDVLALVEDEILLELPMAPLHEADACGVAAAGAKEQKESPFKVLQGLKLGKS
ncbi:hypothetical protein GALL_320530 [mine drainage metagenome]|uniref:Large ribosomal RNA subunit accumulation protein YceD n=1 Tax=mine drainage metagenome TaxID=410659 RepID=A0A1J5QR68_9ZZZZ